MSSNSPGYGPSSGIPGGDGDENDPGPVPPSPEPSRTVDDEPEARQPGRRSRAIDSGIPAPSIDEALLGPSRVIVEEPMPGEEFPDEEEGPIGADRFPVDRGTAFFLLLLMTAVVLLFVVAQASLFLTTLAGWPPVARAAGYALAAILAALFAVSFLGLAWRYVILPVSPGIRLDRPDDLGRRRSVQAQARKNAALAKRRLREFLDRYPADRRHLRFLGSIAGPDAASRLMEHRERLRSLDHATDLDWVVDFEGLVLKPIDAMADTLVTRHAVSVGWKTAIVPTGFLDALIVVANAYHLIGDLCRLYHLRADSWSTLKITAHVFANTFVAGRLEELTDAAADQAFDQMHDLIGGQVARTVLSRFSSGITQGTVNALLLRRFGRSAVRSLRPIRR
jgi:hypothetical protein